MSKPTKPNKTKIATKNDVVMTPHNTAKWIVEYYNPQGTILEPCAGNNVFYNLFNNKKKYRCEITEGLDFFDWTKKVDWIITNPPYSIYDHFLEKAFSISDNVVFFAPIQKALKSEKIERLVLNYGGLKEIIFMGSGRKHKLPFGFTVGCIYYQRNFVGNCKITHKMDW
jgi:hypothetical protein